MGILCAVHESKTKIFSDNRLRRIINLHNIHIVLSYRQHKNRILIFVASQHLPHKYVIIILVIILYLSRLFTISFTEYFFFKL